MSKQSSQRDRLLEDTDSAVALSDSSTPDKRDSSSPSLSEEERYECYGEGGGECEAGGDPIIHLTPAAPKNYLSSDSFRSTSSVGSTGSGRMKTPSHPFLNRTAWQRASGSARRSSTNFPSSQQLYRTGSFNSHQPINGAPNGSRRSSVSYDSDDMFADQPSLEEDVIDLNHKVQSLQQQITALSESQSGNEDKYSRVKQENALLTAKIHSLEEQIRELEVRSEQRIQEEEKKLKDVMARQERLKNEDAEQYSSRIFSLQQENINLKEEVLQLRSTIEKTKLERLQIQEKLNDALVELTDLRDKNRKLQELSRRDQEEHTRERQATNQMLRELGQELEELRAYRLRSETMEKCYSPPISFQELEREIKHLREENQNLREANDELHAQLLTAGLKEGRQLVDSTSGAAHSSGDMSLMAEMEKLSRDEALEKAKEAIEENKKLKAYIDSMLLVIMEHNPQLLECK